MSCTVCPSRRVPDVLLNSEEYINFLQLLTNEVKPFAEFETVKLENEDIRHLPAIESILWLTGSWQSARKLTKHTEQCNSCILSTCC